MMELGSFTSAIELAATLNILYIAVEFSKSYSYIIIRHIVQIDNFVTRCKEECYAHLDEETLKNIPDNIAGKNTKKLREALSIDISKEKSEIDGMKDFFNQLISKRIKASSICFSCISLYLFLFCILSLFYSGVQNEHIFIDMFWLLFTTLSYIIVLGLSLFDGYIHRWVSLKIILMTLFITSIISGSITYIASFTTNPIQQNFFIYNYLAISVVMTAILPYIHFIIYTIKTYYIVKDLKGTMNSHVDETKKRCLEIENKINNFNSFKSTYEQLEISLPDA
ncbi:hypothetical protein [Phocaeicola fibrisolvens]|uniref:hypothetical protein n=1 Tax=Phocaeicola fibrisolvens TaxID=2981793 RepID=UPI0008221BC5|nr:hypothetical protein [Phocaeicola fibrisolvens]MCU6778344.1 hypothetical protein [Phocaeicola fibrisolvens]SCH84402.1 Uncharacterised protein [uncultured Bacteroides sp.]